MPGFHSVSEHPVSTLEMVSIPAINGDISQTFPALTQGLLGDINNTRFGSIDQALPSLTQSATGQIINPVQGNINQSLQEVEQSGSAQILIQGGISQTLPALDQAVTGIVVPAPNNGDISQVLPALTQSLTGTTKPISEAEIVTFVVELAINNTFEAEILTSKVFKVER